MVAATSFEWLEPAFAWLEAEWTEQPWPEVEPGFLEQLGVDRGQVANAPEFAALEALLGYVEQLPDDEQRRALLLDPSARGDALHNFAAEEVTAEAGTAEHGTAQWVEGHGWMRYDEQSGAWVDAEPPDGAEAAPDAAGEAAVDANAFYLDALKEIEAQDAEFAEQIRNDPELQKQIFADVQAALSAE